MHEIESNVIKFIRNVARRRKKDEAEVKRIEGDQGKIYKQDRSDRDAAKRAEETEERNKKMTEMR